MSFSFTNDAAGLKALNTYLGDKSYIVGHTISNIDAAVFGAIACAVDPVALPNVARWYKHIASFDLASAPVTSQTVSVSVGKAGASTAKAPAKAKASPKAKAKASPKKSPKKAPKKPAAKDDDDSDISLFGSDDEDSDDEKAKEERNLRALKAQAERNAKKKVVVGKTEFVYDIKPWDDETDMKEMEKLVRAIKTDGLLWGHGELVEIGYGIKKLRIQSVVEDDKVGSDFLEDNIIALEDHVQSVDTVSVNCLVAGNQIDVK